MSGIFNLQNLYINGIASTTGSGSIIATSCTGNAATANACTGNAATATIASSITITNGTIPTKNTTGVAGTIQYDDYHLYICVATNLWIRILRNNLGSSW